MGRAMSGLAMDPANVVRQCRKTSEVPSGPHDPHAWAGHICPGLGEIEALTLAQVYVIAQRLGLDAFDCLRRLSGIPSDDERTVSA